MARLFRHGNPGLPVVAVQDQCGGFGRTAIHKQYDHLAITLLRSMMRARAIRRAGTGGMQIEGLHYPQTRTTQLPLEDRKYLFAGLIGGENRGK